MWQTFCLVAPHARKHLHLGAGLKLVLFQRDSIENLVYLLAVPLKSHQRTISSWVYASQHINKNNPPIGIFCLPREIQFKIFAELDIRDCTVLGLTSTYFWGLALPILHDRFAADLGPWAGEKIVCVGDLAQAADYPPGLFSDDEILSFDQPEIRRALDYRTSLNNEPRHITLHDFSSLVMSCEQHLGTIWKFLKKELLFSSCCDSLAEYKLLTEGTAGRDFKNFEENCFYPRDQPWVLRNLTTKEFIRSEAIALKPEFIQGPRIQGIGFSHVILSRICWSSVPNVDIGDPPRIPRGVWAGHCFDITQLSNHIEMTQGETWIDVSSEVMDDISRIWEHKYGPGWREHVIESVEQKRIELCMDNTNDL